MRRDHLAKATLDAADAHAQDSGSSASLRWTAHCRGWMHLALMEWDEACAAFQHVIEMDSRASIRGFAVSGYVGLMIGALCSGRDAEARTAFAGYTESNDKPEQGTWHSFALLAEALLRCREGASASTVRTLIGEAADGFARLGVGLGETAAELAHAYVAIREGGANNAEKHLENALSQLREMGAHDQAERVRAAFQPLLEQAS